MTEEQLQQILESLKAHDERLTRLETILTASPELPKVNKQKTLREIVKGKKFKNGQEQLAAIVGYHEILLGKPILKGLLENEWNAAKMPAVYDKSYIKRAKNNLFRIAEDDTCILTQTGEKVFETLLKNEPADATS